MTSTTETIKIDKPRYAYLDLFRLLSAMAVVLIHLTASAIVRYQPSSLPLLVVTALNGLILFAVPAFIFISAYTFMFIYLGKKIDLITFFKKRVAVLILPYFLWTLVYYLDQLYFSKGQFNLVEFMKHLLLGTSFYHLYFIPIIIQFYLLFIPLKWAFEKYNAFIVLCTSFILFYVYTAGLPFTHVNPFIASVNSLLPLKSELIYADRFFMSYLPFYTLGLYLALVIKTNRLHLNKLLPLVLPLYMIYEYAHTGGRIAYYVYQKNFDFVLPYAWEMSSILSIMLLLSFCMWIEKKGVPLQAVVQLSGYTFTLYLAHPLILQFCEIKLVPLLSGSYSLSLAITLVLAIGIPLLGSWLFKNLQLKFKS